MTELKERVAAKTRTKSAIVSDWLVDGTTASVIAKEAVEGSKILARLRAVLDQKFQAAGQSDYEKDSSERERAFDAGYRKALKDIYRLLQLDT